MQNIRNAKFIIGILLLVINFKIETMTESAGANLQKLKMRDIFGFTVSTMFNNCSVIKEFDVKRNIYLVNVLNQNNDSTCGRHVCKNLIFFMNALEQTNKEDLKKKLQYLYDKNFFYDFNKELCNYWKIGQINLGLTFPHKLFRLFLNFESFLKDSNNTRLIIPFNFKEIISKICPIPLSFDKNNVDLIKTFVCNLHNEEFLAHIEQDKTQHVVMIEFYKKYLLNNKLTTKNDLLYSHIFPSDDVKKVIDDFKSSKQDMLGLIVLQPSMVGHWIGIVIKKVNINNFEFFVLDSEIYSTIHGSLSNTLNSLLALFQNPIISSKL